MSAAFEDFWKNFPARNGIKARKGEALRVWTQKKLDAKALEIMLALSVQVAHKKKCDAAKVFCAEFPDAVRWIRHERWRDEVTETKRHEMLAHTEPSNAEMVVAAPGVYVTNHTGQPPGVFRRRVLSSVVQGEHPEWSHREVEAEATRRWRAEGWEERV